MVLLDDLFNISGLRSHFLDCLCPPRNEFLVQKFENIEELVTLARVSAKLRKGIKEHVELFLWKNLTLPASAFAPPVFDYENWIKRVWYTDLRTYKIPVVGGFFRGQDVSEEEEPNTEGYRSPISPFAKKKQPIYCIHKIRLWTNSVNAINSMREEHWDSLGRMRIWLDGRGPYCMASYNWRIATEDKDENTYYNFCFKTYTGCKYYVKGELRVKMNPPKVVSFLWTLPRETEAKMTKAELSAYDEKIMKRTIQLLNHSTDLKNIAEVQVCEASRFDHGVLVGDFKDRINISNFVHWKDKNQPTVTFINKEKTFYSSVFDETIDIED